MFNYKCKSHSGQSLTILKAILPIIMFGSYITRAYAVALPNKTVTRLMCIIVNQVLKGT